MISAPPVLVPINIQITEEDIDEGYQKCRNEGLQPNRYCASALAISRYVKDGVDFTVHFDETDYRGIGIAPHTPELRVFIGEFDRWRNNFGSPSQRPQPRTVQIMIWDSIVRHDSN